MELKHEEIANELEIKNEDTKLEAFEKEIKLISKVQSYLFKRERFNEDYGTKKEYFEKFAEDLRIYFNH